jgi:hypothetical protein
MVSAFSKEDHGSEKSYFREESGQSEEQNVFPSKLRIEAVIPKSD